MRPARPTPVAADPHEPFLRLPLEIQTISTEATATEALPQEATPDDAVTAAEEPAEGSAPPTGRSRNGLMPSKEQARIAAAAAFDRKAEDLKILDLSEISGFTDIFLICSGNSERQVKAIAENIEKELRDQKVKPLHAEGYPASRWILLDYGGDMVIHVFHRETRSFYELERLWSDAPDLTAELTKGLVPDEDASEGDFEDDAEDA